MSELDHETETRYAGEYTVETLENNFGEVLQHGLDSDHVLFMVLPKIGGWKASKECLHGCLSHQTYKKKVRKILNGEPRKPREIAIVGLNTAEWKTVWSGDGEHHADSRGNDRIKFCPKCDRGRNDD